MTLVGRWLVLIMCITVVVFLSFKKKKKKNLPPTKIQFYHHHHQASKQASIIISKLQIAIPFFYVILFSFVRSLFSFPLILCVCVCLYVVIIFIGSRKKIPTSLFHYVCAAHLLFSFFTFIDDDQWW